MLGVDDSPQNLGVLPCAISWLFRLINEQKDQTGARFSVRVSAVEVTGKQEQLKDLLADVATGEYSVTCIFIIELLTYYCPLTCNHILLRQLLIKQFL